MFSTLKDKLSTNPMDPMLEMLDESGVSATHLAQITSEASNAMLAGSHALLGTPDDDC